MEKSRGDAAAATWIFRGDEPRTRRYEAPSGASRGRRPGSPPPGARGGRGGSPPRDGSPPPGARDLDDELQELVYKEKEEPAPENRDHDELEGFVHRSEATGLYSGDRQEPKFPKHLELKLWDMAENDEERQSAFPASGRADFRGDEARRRRGCHVDSPRRRAAATPRPPRG